MAELKLPECPQLALQSLLADLKSDNERDFDGPQLEGTLPGDLSLTELGAAYERMKELRKRLQQYRDILAVTTTGHQRETHHSLEK